MAADSCPRDREAWKHHIVRAGPHLSCSEDEPDPDTHRVHLEPWLSTLLQAEHLNLLVGSGLTTAIAQSANVSHADMRRIDLECEFAGAVDEAANRAATRLGRDEPNIEYQIRAVGELIGGLRILARAAQPGRGGALLPKSAKRLLPAWEQELDRVLLGILKQVLATERGIAAVMANPAAEQADRTRRLLGSFLLAFASRAVTRDRLHIFTTNYDRLIEYGCDLLGLRMLDRFVGNLAPIFRTSRLGIDLHYNPPGILGEPHYLEGVVRLTKLHGSLDWRSTRGPSGGLEVQRCALPFGASDDHPEVPENARDHLLIYPNPAKDVETLEYPYAELFRDLAAAACRPNVVLVTYGYGFGDDHINRVLRDMLSLPSTHLIIISYDDAEGRLWRFFAESAREEQITLLVGSHFGDLGTLVHEYLPQPAIERATWRMADLLNRRPSANCEGAATDPGDGTADNGHSV